LVRTYQLVRLSMNFISLKNKNNYQSNLNQSMFWSYTRSVWVSINHEQNCKKWEPMNQHILIGKTQTWEGQCTACRQPFLPWRREGATAWSWWSSGPSRCRKIRKTSTRSSWTSRSKNFRCSFRCSTVK
jgi:hypothetical protein